MTPDVRLVIELILLVIRYVIIRYNRTALDRSHPYFKWNGIYMQKSSFFHLSIVTYILLLCSWNFNLMPGS